MSNENSISYVDFKEKMLSYFSSHVKVKTQMEMIQIMKACRALIQIILIGKQ